MRVNGAAVAAIRTAQQRNQRDVAAAAGIDCGYLSRIERGKKGAGSRTIDGLAQSLKVPVEAISYPDPPVPQASPATVRRIVELLQMPADAAEELLLLSAGVDPL
jgi:transcriptional regulator with XRE-family HTH domain